MNSQCQSPIRLKRPMNKVNQYQVQNNAMQLSATKFFSELRKRRLAPTMRPFKQLANTITVTPGSRDLEWDLSNLLM